MLRFRAASVAGFSSHRGTFAAAVGAHHQHVQQRGITTRGQFNPIHTFDCHAHGGNVPTREEFSILITNPGPLRVGYSPDYLEWLYGCYQAKIHYAQEREKAENTFNGSLLSRGSGTKGDSQKHQHSHLAPPPGKQLRPPHSFRRRAGEAKRAHAQRTLDATSCQQGMLDLFERQPQFPVIHLDKAERFHVVELFKELVLERALEPMELWDKALLYRAILSERRASYPRSFDYIFQCIQHTQLAPTPEGGASSGSSQPTHPLLPSVEDYNYFVYLVKKYFVENAVEGHVVLRCHREPNAAALLFGTPAPKDDAEVFRIMFSQKEAAGGSGEGAENPAPSTSSSPRVRVPTNYPPIDALWRCPENEALLRILMFGELNLIVSENPFATKFPQALGFLTRPQAGGAPSSSSSSPSSSSSSPSPSQAQQRRGGRGGSGGGGGVPLSSLIAARRGHLMAPLPRHIEMALDGRANDLRRLQTRHQREDSVGVQRLLRPGSAEVEEHPAQFSAYADWAYFNPRAVRAEARDLHTRTAVEAMKMYAEAAEDRYRDGYETVEVQSMRRPMESLHVAPTYTPTQAHFLAILLKDKHLSFLRHVALGGHPEKSAELHKAATRLARALWRMAMDYHQEPLRRIHRQKVLVAAALLDGFVERVWAEVAGPSSAAEEARDERRRMALRLGSYTPMEKRVWDESGFPTDARAEDYQRWMAAPATA